MTALYNLFIRFYRLGATVAAPFNAKARQWITGRRQLFQQLAADFPATDPVVWIHSASAGEFEQAKPVITALKTTFPHYKILVTFFSPSGYGVGKKFPGADYIYYLPEDTPANAERFLAAVQPKLVLFIKYDYWYHHLKAIHNRGIPLLLVSALFRESQPFFKPYGTLHRQMLHFFTHLFVQDQTSYGLLKKLGVLHATPAGDTRFDRVQAIFNKFEPVPFLPLFAKDCPVLVAGSTWPDDETALATLHGDFKKLKLVIAPHEINAPHIAGIQKKFPAALLYSQLMAAPEKDWSNTLHEASVLVIDNIGLLSRLYHYATLTYIGGGFNKSGIHNTLEAAVYGKPVLFGPNYKKFREARELIAAGAAFSYTTGKELTALVGTLLSAEEKTKAASTAAFTYVQRNGGATQQIIAYIQENRLLTNV